VTRRRLLIAALLLLCGGVLDAASLVDPARHFKTLRTAHFIIYFHQGEDRSAASLAVIAEQTWTALRRPLGATPPKLTHVILADQTELSNGFATPRPERAMSRRPAVPVYCERQPDIPHHRRGCSSVPGLHETWTANPPGILARPGNRRIRGRAVRRTARCRR